MLSIFGSEEAQKKMMFEKWWKTLSPKDFTKSVEILQKEYIAWFNQLNIKTKNK